MEQWMRANKAKILELQALCRESGCPANVAGEIVMLLAGCDGLREAASRPAVDLPVAVAIVDARVERKLREELSAALSDWVLANLWRRPGHASTGG